MVVFAPFFLSEFLIFIIVLNPYDTCATLETFIICCDACEVIIAAISWKDCRQLGECYDPSVVIPYQLIESALAIVNGVYVESALSLRRFLIWYEDIQVPRYIYPRRTKYLEEVPGGKFCRKEPCL